MKICVCSRAEIEAGIAVESDFVVISIHDPDQPPARVKKQLGLRDVLFLAFHDARHVTDLPPHIQPMTPAHAVAIRDFVRRHQTHIAVVVVHCESGYSRSPAVAAAISEALGLDSRRFWQDYEPNQHVYHSVMDAFEEADDSTQGQKG